ncbi:MAG: LeuA family protein, partial [Sciscionella sp.]
MPVSPPRSAQDSPIPERVEVIDCTLRDGEQAPGVVFTVEEKLRIATSLSVAGVDLLDAGFPAGGGDEIETLQELTRLELSAGIGATARPFRADVAAADKAMAQEVFLFMPSSDARIEKTLGMTRERAVGLFRDGAEDVVGRGMGLNVVFEDATRADSSFLVRFVELITASVPVARVIIADTAGCARPDTMAALVRELRAALDPAVRLCPHCHNDFGLATANTLAAVAAGCESVTCTVNGLGERAGNADLAEVAAGLRYLYGTEHSVDLVQLQRIAQLVERVSGVHTSFTKPVTGL